MLKMSLSALEKLFQKTGFSSYSYLNYFDFFLLAFEKFKFGGVRHCYYCYECLQKMFLYIIKHSLLTMGHFLRFRSYWHDKNVLKLWKHTFFCYISCSLTLLYMHKYNFLFTPYQSSTDWCSQNVAYWLQGYSPRAMVIKHVKHPTFSHVQTFYIITHGRYNMYK